MKKLFTLVALLAIFLGAKAATKTVVDYEKSDFTGWSAGWASDDAASRLSVVDGCIHFHSEEATANFFDVQFLAFGVENLDNDFSYTITIRIKGSVAGKLHSSFSGSNTPGDFAITTDWQDVVLEGCVNDPNAQYFANSGQLNIQCGDYVGDWDISYVKITHEEQESSVPVVWLEQLTDDGTPEGKYMGDAEFGQWPAWALEKNGQSSAGEPININWRGDRTGEICAWSIVRGLNIDPSQTPDEVKAPDSEGGYVIEEGKPRPFPCEITVDPTNENNHVFVVHSTAADNQFTDWQSWDNQFFIQSPKSWKSGTKVKLHFKYMAEKAATANTQIHRQNPSWYLFYQAVGDVSFTNEWQNFDKEFTFSDSQGGGWSVAFNLNVDNKEPNTFYFDDLSWQVMKLDEGWFVAASNAAAGIDYDFAQAAEMTYDASEDAYVATVGTEGKKDTWVNEVMISTVRGDNAAFKGATIKPSSGSITGNDEDNWQEYVDAASTKIKLPAAGVWQIFVAPHKDKEGGQILFMQLDGDAPKEVVDVVANPAVLVIKGVERQDLIDTKDNDGKITVREDADDPNGVNVGGEGHEGQTWDNQFFIVANRVLNGDEVTVLEFDYVATAEATCPSGTHAAPGAYRKNAFADFTFKTEEQHLKVEYTVPAKDWSNNDITDAQSISFDMAVIKGACDYTIKNVKWYLKNDTEGKTTENLIDATGTKNFKVKIGKDNQVLDWGADTDGIANVSAKNAKTSAVIYNLAGQRVSNSFKGIVVKDGKKMINK